MLRYVQQWLPTSRTPPPSPLPWLPGHCSNSGFERSPSGRSTPRPCATWPPLSWHRRPPPHSARTLSCAEPLCAAIARLAPPLLSKHANAGGGPHNQPNRPHDSTRGVRRRRPAAAYWRLLKAIYDLPLLGMFARVRPRRGELTSSIGSAGRAYTWLI